MRSLPARIGCVAVFVLAGCRGVAGENPKPRADTQGNAPAAGAKADDRLARLERSVASLQATVDAQARQLHCVEVQRATRAAWYEHDQAVLTFIASSCNLVAGVCSDTGLPPNTFGRYRLLASQVVGETDAPFDTLREGMDQLPELPHSPVRSDAIARIRSTREAAESATKAYLAECDPADG
jgi:hypothetical protein